MPLRIALALFALSVPAAAGAEKAKAEKADAGARPYELVFTGNEAVSEASLRQAVERDMEAYAARGRRKAFVDDAAFEIRRHYLGRGFREAAVAYRIEEGVRIEEGGEGFAPRVVFEVTEGPRTVVEEIRLEGVTSFAPRDLSAFFELPRSGLLGKGPRLFVESRLEAGADALLGYYLDAGFLDAEVEPPEPRFSEDRTLAQVTVTVHEGVRYRLRRLHFEGETALPESDLEEARKGMLERPYTPRVSFEILGRLKDVYGHRGYPDAAFEVATELDPETGDAALTYAITPGPQVTVSRVVVAGDPKTRQSFLLSRVSVEAGKLYDSREVTRSFQRLYQTGLFSKVRLELEDAQATERELRIEVEEDLGLELFVEPGYGSYERLRVLSGLERKNLFGSGSNLRLRLLVAQRAQTLSANLSTPWIFDGRVKTDVSVVGGRREEPGFTSQNWGAGVFFRREHSPRFTTSAGYQYRFSFLDDVVVPPEENPDVNISSVRLSARYDDRDNLFVPRRGFGGSLSLEYSAKFLASELDFFRGQLQAAYYRPLGEHTVLALSWRFGAIRPLGDTETIPRQELFFNGGDSSVRSFGESRLGPVDSNGDPLGGEGFQVASVELRRKLWGNLHGAVFYDAGELVPEAEDLFRFDDVRTGTGLGLRYLLPIGPVRLDGAWNPSPRPGEEDFVLHLSVGMAF